MRAQADDSGEDDEGVRGSRRAGNWSAQVQVDDPELLFFRLCGLKKLGFTLVASSLRDMLAEQAGQDLEAPARMSAAWLDTGAGRAWLEFLIPGASADALMARIHEDPERILRAIDARMREFQLSADSPAPRSRTSRGPAGNPASTEVVGEACAEAGAEVDSEACAIACEFGVHSADPRLAEQISAVNLLKPIFDQLELDLMPTAPYPMGALELAAACGHSALESAFDSRPSFA
jgi:hypothetical protein